MNTGSTTARSGADVFRRRVAWMVATRLAIGGSGLLSGVIIARWLGAGATGIFASLSVISMLAINVGALGLPSATTFLVARERGRTNRVLAAALVVGLLSGTAFAVGLSLAALYRPDLFGEVPPELLIITSAAIPLQMMAYLALAGFLGMERIRRYNLIELSISGLLLVNIAITVAGLGFGIAAVIKVGAVVNSIAGVAFMLMLIQHVGTSGGRWQFDLDVLRQMMKYGARFFVSMAAGLVILRGDLLIVNYFRGAEEAGVYAVAAQTAAFLHMIPNVISTILFPRTAGARDESGHLTCRVTRHSVFLMLIICVGAVPLAFILPLLYGPAFSAVTPLFLILLPGVFLLGIETIQVQHFTGLGLPRMIPAFWVGVMIGNIILNLALVPALGHFGAAVASSISYAVVFVLVAAYFRDRTGRSLRESFVVGYDEFRIFMRETLLQVK